MFKYFKYSRMVLAPIIFTLIFLLFANMPKGGSLILFSAALGFVSVVLLWPKFVENFLLGWFYDDLQFVVNEENSDIKCFYGTPHAFQVEVTDPLIPEVKKSIQRIQAEHIVASAVRHPSGLIFAVFRPGRHHHVFHGMSPFKASGFWGGHHVKDQGFITSLGRYVDRAEGAKVARKAEQLVRMPTPDDNLTSEDVWLRTFLPPGESIPPNVPLSSLKPSASKDQATLEYMRKHFNETTPEP